MHIETLEERSLREALQYAACKELPPMWRDSDSDKKYWLDAIVLVKKRGMRRNYAIARRDGRGVISYIRDFGEGGIIGGLVSVFPYVYLDPALTRNLKDDDFEGRERAIARQRQGHWDDVSRDAQEGAAAEASKEEDGVEELEELPLPSSDDGGEGSWGESGEGDGVPLCQPVKARKSRLVTARVKKSKKEKQEK